MNKMIYSIVTFALAIVGVIVMAHGDHVTGGFLLANAAAAPDLETLAKEFKDATSHFKTKADELGQMHTELKSKMSESNGPSKELKESVDKALIEFKGMRDNITELEQKLAQRKGKDEPEEAKSWGQQIAESEGFKSFSEKGGSGTRSSFRHEVKQVTSASAGGLIRQPYRDELVSLPRERRIMRDLMRVIPIQTSSVDYPVQTLRTNNAAPVAEGAAKPYSDYVWGSATVPVRTLAHLAKLTRQAIDDAPRLVGEVDSEMRYGLGLIEERQFLYGNGTGQNLAGIVPQASAFAKPVGFVDTAATRIDVLRLAMLQVSLAMWPADGIVLNESDWALIELTKTTDGAYLFANPQGSVSPRMWGLPVVNTPAMDVGDFLVGAFQIGATVYDRMGVEVLISTENDKDFENNLATMRAEERVAIGVKRPNAFVTGEFAASVAALKV